jgi:hypothetical protein
LLLAMWFGGCALAAPIAAALSTSGDPWFLPLVALAAAQTVVLAGRAALWPRGATWSVALLTTGAGALGQHGAGLAVYLGLGSALLLLADRFAALSVDLTVYGVQEHGTAGRRTLHTTTLADPVARELARARREERSVAIASISVPRTRGSSRRLGHIARDMAPSLRRTDAIVRAFADRMVVVLPRADTDVALAVLGRTLPPERDDVLIGTATFPRDAATWASLKDVARSREQPWSTARGAMSGPP